MEHFDAARAVELVERTEVNVAFLVPTMMRRMLMADQVWQRDLSSLKAVVHGAASCPEPVKRAWIDLVGAECLYEAYGATDGVGMTVIRGDEWLARPGSVGRAEDCDVQIVAPDGSVCGPREVGEIFMRRHDGGKPPRCLGETVPSRSRNGYTSVGDRGWLDESGYLYVAGRCDALIISGGVNIDPAEIEDVLSRHPEVADVAVLGMPDEDLGQRVHARIEPAAPAHPPAVEQLTAWCRGRLSREKQPHSFEVVDDLARTDMGKLPHAVGSSRGRRSAQRS